MKRLAFPVVIAALLVSAPRLAMAFLLADGVQLAPAVEMWVFAGTGVASGVVLTGGNVYLAHALAEHWRRRGGLWAILLVAWTLFLVFAILLIAPALVYGLNHSALATVLTTPAARWGWSVVAALSVEVLAAAAMAAGVLSAEPSKPSAEGKRTEGIQAALSGRIVRILNADAHASRAQANATSAAQVPESSAWVTESVAQSDAMPAPSVVAPAPMVYQCDQCPKSYLTKNALSAHQRFCKSAQEPAR